MIAKGCCPAATSDRRVPVTLSPERPRSETNRRLPASAAREPPSREPLLGLPSPGQSRAYGSAPTSHQLLALCPIHPWLESGKTTARKGLIAGLPHTHRQACQARRPRGRSSRPCRAAPPALPGYRPETASTSRWLRRPVHPQCGNIEMIGSRHRGQQLRTVECHCLQSRPNQMRSAGAPGYAGDGASRFWFPVRRSHSYKRGHEIHATGVGNAARGTFALRRVAE